MNAKKYAIPAAAVLGLAVSGVVLAQWLQGLGPLPPQPIAFNHKLHLARIQGVSCSDCHQFVATQTYAGLPSKYVCFGCHDPAADKKDASADANKPAFADLMRFAASEGDIPWHRVTAHRDDVFFSHRRHVTVAKIDCKECHADMPARSSPPTRGPIVMRMTTCLSCHRSHKASDDCVSCHR